ncbi:MAG: SH3 domain-containing protein [Deferribacterales bacterium]
MYRKTLLLLITFLTAGILHAANYANVTVPSLSIYSKPSTNADITGTLKNGAGVEILEKKNGWVRIKLPEGATGYVKNQGLKATTVKPEPASISDQVEKLLNKFNKTVLESEYAKTKKVVPSLSLASVRSQSDMTFVFCAVNLDGKKVPSLRRNPLAKNMRELIELSFLKMLKKPSPMYRIAVETPYFGDKGVINGTNNYAVFTIQAEKEQINQVEKGTISVWNLVRSTKKLGMVFEDMPH